MHQRALDLGATAVIAKPFQPQVVGEILRQALAGAEQPGGLGSGLRPLGP
jgi:CheY-like chemotaxis protein